MITQRVELDGDGTFFTSPRNRGKRLSALIPSWGILHKLRAVVGGPSGPTRSASMVTGFAPKRGQAPKQGQAPEACPEPDEGAFIPSWGLLQKNNPCGFCRRSYREGLNKYCREQARSHHCLALWERACTRRMRSVLVQSFLRPDPLRDNAERLRPEMGASPEKGASA